MLGLERTPNQPNTAPGLLSEPKRADVLSYLKFGRASDSRSVAALYRTEGSDDGVTAPSPASRRVPNRDITTTARCVYAAAETAKYLRVPQSPRGTFGIHDLRNAYSSPSLRRVFSLNLVFSMDYLEDVGPQSAHRAMNLLKDRVAYDFVDETLMHIALALVPEFQRPETSIACLSIR